MTSDIVLVTEKLDTCINNKTIKTKSKHFEPEIVIRINTVSLRKNLRIFNKIVHMHVIVFQDVSFWCALSLLLLSECLFVRVKQFSINWSRRILDLTLLNGPPNFPNFDSNKQKILACRKKIERPDNMG